MKPAGEMKPSERPKISVVLMAFNEESGLEDAVREIVFVLRGLEQTYEVIIVNDGSSDSTGAVAERITREITGIRVIHHPANRGLGGVYRTGFDSARGDLVTFYPADRQFPASIIKQLFSLIPDQDMILGYIPDRNDSFQARILSRGEKILYGILFGPMPRFQGILMFRQRLLEEIKLKSNGRGWTILMELIIRAARGGYRIISVPTDFSPRLSGKSKVCNLSAVWDNFKQLISLRCSFNLN
jgi:dolichol-phosphate mannosyltransferase